VKLFAEPIAAVVGVVVIGRNERPRLRGCLESVGQPDCPIVYVDSASTDGSAELAESMGIPVIVLDNSQPHTADRARNAGWRWLRDHHPAMEFIQFVDGDTILSDGWLPAGTRHLRLWNETAAVSGLLREQRPADSIYNRLCDIEWRGPTGKIDEFGGLFMGRIAALEQVGGFSETVIAAEDTELSARLRKSGWRLERIEVDMGAHDANMSHFTQWWRRTVRSGHAHAEMHHLHGRAPLWCRSRRVLTNWLWSILLPLAAIAATPLTAGWSLTLLLAYPLLAGRILLNHRRRLGWRSAALYAIFCIAGKAPETLGQILFHWNRFRRRRSRLIEYKRELEGSAEESTSPRQFPSTDSASDVNSNLSPKT
jgi:cellulose synthase/poly-beta-1,6-N-acetylglucosamine synthase-like glycosyltransferase